MICQNVNCTKNASKKIRFNILASTGNEPAIAEPEIYVCDEHATEESAAELMVGNPEGRKQIEQAFRDIGKAAPDWSRSWAEWVEIWHRV